MLKIIKVILFISLIFSVFNLYSEDYSTIVQGDDEEVSELLQKALNQSILKVLGSQRDFNLNQQSFKKLNPNNFVREYKIKGEDKDGFFRVTGMDGLLELDENIIPLNYWNKDILKEKELFDTQKGIVRKITVKKLKDEKIKINKSKLLTEKYTFNATKNPKDKGPFPEYTLWYYKDELLKMEFKNPNDKKNTITIIRNDWEQ